MVKRSRVRYPVHVTLYLKRSQKEQLDEIARLTDGAFAEIIRRMIDREAPLFLEHASATARLLNGEE